MPDVYEESSPKHLFSCCSRRSRKKYIVDVLLNLWEFFMAYIMEQVKSVRQQGELEEGGIHLRLNTRQSRWAHGSRKPCCLPLKAFYLQLITFSMNIFVVGGVFLGFTTGINLTSKLKDRWYIDDEFFSGNEEVSCLFFVLSLSHSTDTGVGYEDGD